MDVSKCSGNKKALKLFEDAAQGGCQNAYFHLGEIYEVKGDTEKAAPKS